MLILTRGIGEEIVIGDNIRVCVTGIRGDKVRIGITAPKFVRVDRDEVYQRRNEFLDVPQATDGGEVCEHTEEVTA